MSNAKKWVERVAQGLNETTPDALVLVGFDGFIDNIISVVDKRQSAEQFDAIPTISDFGARITAAAGYSANLELVTNQVKLGGNGPIMAFAMASQGYPVDYLGCVGHPNIHPVFEPLSDACTRVISCAEPGITDALEFRDGKLMFGKHDTLREVTWENLIKAIPEEELASLLAKCGLVSCTNWTMLPYMNGIYEGIKTLLSQTQNRPYVFYDLCDPQKREDTDILEALQIIGGTQEHAKVILGLNENESIQIAQVLLGKPIDDLTERCTVLRKKLGIEQVVVHPTRSAAVSWDGGVAYIDGPFTNHPKLTTGAGDNFNAGFCNGLLSGFSPEECIASGVCSSGFYVRQCRSANRQELADFAATWLTNDLGDMD